MSEAPPNGRITTSENMINGTNNGLGRKHVGAVGGGLSQSDKDMIPSRWETEN